MKAIQMVDLKSQYDKIKEEVDSRIQGVLSTSTFINGPEVKGFQAELEQYLQMRYK
jgi:UDP-2-acetamido-2-deoxy-ribo-hexuluronate aminotransferase